MKRILVVAPNEFGFRQYAQDLALASSQKSPQHGFNRIEPLFFDSFTDRKNARELLNKIESSHADLVHLHHEYGMLGSKIPGRYYFPAWVRSFRERLPKTKLVATAHTVIQPGFYYPSAGRGWQAPFRWLANQVLLPSLKKLWNEDTWGQLDGVIVHSRHQIAVTKNTGCRVVACIPHYVPDRYEKGVSVGQTHFQIPEPAPWIIVFGYFTPEKAQDLVIRAFQQMRVPAHLIFAGGVRREADQSYFQHCQALIRASSKASQIHTTGFVSWEDLDYLSARAAFAVLPFRETSGSGSLADLMARKMAMLASDLPLNREIAERVEDALAYFRTDDEDDLACQMNKLLEDPSRCQDLKASATRYAMTFSPAQVLRQHEDFYQAILG